MLTVLRRATAIVHEMIDRYLTAYGVSVQYFMDQVAGMYVSDIGPPDDGELIH